MFTDSQTPNAVPLTEGDLAEGARHPIITAVTNRGREQAITTPAVTPAGHCPGGVCAGGNHSSH